MSPFINVEEAITRFRDGKMLILVDDADRENEGDLIIAAEHVTPEAINFMSLYGRGLVCMPIAAKIAKQLHLTRMVTENASREGTPFLVSIGAAEGITTGISPADRAHTVLTATAAGATADDIVSPGHVFPLLAEPQGVLKRRGHTEGCVDLATLAGLRPGAVLCEIVNPDGTMARMPELEQFAVEHDIGLLTIDDLVKYRLQHEAVVELAATAKMPLHHVGDMLIRVYQNPMNAEQFVVIHGDEIADNPLLRIHSECFTGDTLGSMRCDCGHQLHASLEQIAADKGVLIYMPQEGRGIGLANKIKAYALQDQGLDTVEANHQLGLPIDSRDYSWCAQILKALERGQVRLLTNNPAKVEGLEAYGIEVTERVPLEMPSNPHNKFYLQTKKDKLGHILSEIDNAS